MTKDDKGEGGERKDEMAGSVKRWQLLLKEQEEGEEGGLAGNPQNLADIICEQPLSV